MEKSGIKPLAMGEFNEWGVELSSPDIDAEQRYVSMLYARLDGMRDRSAGRLAAALRQSTGTHQARSERDAVVARYTEQVAQYNAVENGLVFGRLDFDDGGRRYIGRIGIFDDSGEYEPLLMDWRAPAARPFYLARAASPDGVTRRRHIRTRLRRVVGLDDEVLDLTRADEADGHALTGEAALLAALGASRTGRMRDIVETIQAEQDVVIRSGLSGALVVQGGPGTGKTAVALHRAAYLLYTYRGQLSAQGVLVVGPNATFLRYISQVLPSLAENGVLLRTVGQLFPGTVGHRAEAPDIAEIKGRLVFADVLASAVADRQSVPPEGLDVEVDEQVLRLFPATIAAARERARRTGRPHNLARPVFAASIVDVLARELAERIGADPYADDPLGGDDAPGAGALLLGEADLAELREDLRTRPEVLAAVEHLWPELTPHRLVTDLFADPDRLAAAAPQLSTVERKLLFRPAGEAWTDADIPLLDEAAELLGEDTGSARRRVDRRRRAEIAYAQGVLDIATGSGHLDNEDEPHPEILTATDLIDAERLAGRHEDGEYLTTAQRAAIDRTWAYGHVIVDEAQELSPMAWRVLMRRCPSRSMTIVGDMAQTGALDGAGSWSAALDLYLAGRWRLAELTVSYRTPAEIMAVAERLLATIDPTTVAPRAVRETGTPPWTVHEGQIDLGTLVRREADAVGDGRLGVIVPDGRLAEVSTVVPEAAVGEDPELEATVVVLTVRQAKGLEFDSVLVVDPGGIVAESPRGTSDLYVALTRATQRLGIVHAGDLPDELAGLSRVPAMS